MTRLNLIPLLMGIVDCLLGYTKLKNSNGYWNPKDLLEIVDTIWDEGVDVAQFIALSLLEVAGSSLLWNLDFTNRLRQFGNYKNIGIRTVALDIWTATE